MALVAAWVRSLSLLAVWGLLPSRRFRAAPEHRPEEGGGILARWHDLGHPEVSLGKVRKVAQLPFWLALVTPASQSDIAKVERELGLPPSHAPAQGTLALD